MIIWSSFLLKNCANIQNTFIYIITHTLQDLWNIYFENIGNSKWAEIIILYEMLSLSTGLLRVPFSLDTLVKGIHNPID